MKLLHLMTSQPYFAEPEAFRAAIELLSSESIKSLATRKGDKVANYTQMRDGVAVVSMFGPIFRHANLMTELCEDGVTTARLALELQAAMDSPDVRAIVLEIDSPGGEATGISELASTIHAMSKVKPIIAYVGGTGASAAYYLASAASEIIASPMARLGSIGTVIGYRDESARDERLGIKNVEIVSSQSPKKRLDPSSDAGREAIQELIDDMTNVFVADVAKYRGVSVETVLSDFGQGGVMLGEKAVKAGLADRLGSFEGLLQELNGSRWDRARGQTSRSGGLKVAASVPTPQRESKVMKVADFLRNHKLFGSPETIDLSALAEDSEKSLSGLAASLPQVQPYNGDPTGQISPAVLAQGIKEDPAVAALKAQVAQLQAANAASQASATLLSLRDRLTPAQTSLLQPFLVQCAADDLSSPLQQGSRVEALRAALAAGVQHNVTNAQLNDDGTLKTVENHVEPKAADAAPTQAELDALLAKTELGRAALARREGK